MKLKVALFPLWMLMNCGVPANEEKVAVADHPDALTSSPNDNLFTLTLTKSKESYVLSELMVDATLPGQSGTAVNFVLNDLNGDGKWNEGEALSCKEPPVNLFDATTVGKKLSISVSVKQESGPYVSFAGSSWTPAN